MCRVIYNGCTVFCVYSKSAVLLHECTVATYGFKIVNSSQNKICCLNQARGRCAAGFLKLFLCRLYACVCLSAPEAMA